ncbi:ankyrin repeat domain-containing protein [Demequina silvatica]|uniref:ankyrin repeat domain-containing protein n=1 Tax=Demequina silvatica TaxID=1638988 RepID=UPI0009E2A5B8|nr:ankyrin repeat domain-containing protein [Demequina silvatica]
MRLRMMAAALAALVLAGCTGGSEASDGASAAPSIAAADTATLTPDQRLMAAAVTGDVASAQGAIAEGASAGAIMGWASPLHAAAHHGHADVVQLLLDAGASVDQTVAGDTPLHLAALSDDAATVAALVRAGADVEAGGGQDADMTPLMIAMASGSTEAAGALLEAGASWTIGNTWGVDPLQWAVFFGEEDAIAWALAHGADVASIEEDGTLRSEVAEEWEWPELANYLRTVE